MAETGADLPIRTELADGTPTIIDSPERLNQAVEKLATSSAPVAIDTERAQGFRYGNEAWLVQVRREGAGTFLIDSHALPQLGRLSEVLAAPWILHSAGQDIPSLEELGMVPERIFDTELAARLVGIKQFSLQGTCEQMLGFTLEKVHQNENWSIRPLPQTWLRYAAMDVDVLPDLHRALTARLEELGRTTWAEQEFEYARTHPVISQAPKWQNLKGIGKLRKPAELAVARELWETREEIAKQLDLSPGRLLNNRGIIEAAQRNPKTRRELSRIEAFRRPRARTYSDQWWNAVKRAHSLTPDEMPASSDSQQNGAVPALRTWKRLRPTAVPRLQAVRALVEKTAEPLVLDPEVVLLPATQRLLAWDPLPAGHTLEQVQRKLIEGEARPWQIELLLREASGRPELLRPLKPAPIR